MGRRQLGDGSAGRSIRATKTLYVPGSIETWTASGLKRTLEGFGQKFLALKHEDAELLDKVEFRFISNRTTKANVLDEIDALASGRRARNQSIRRGLISYAGLEDARDIKSFFAMFRVVDAAPGLLLLKREFRQELGSLLPGDAGDGWLRLKELITERATSHGAEKGPIFAVDVLAALEVNDDDLLPAPSLIQVPREVVVRDGWSSMVDTIVLGSGPAIVHAPGGVGKSVFAGAIANYLPAGSMAVTFDCFASGDYTRLSGTRHEHRVALTQIANELAVAGLCDPLIPTTASSRAYMKVFKDRVNLAAEALTTDEPGSLLCVVVDAADNAVMASEQFGEKRCFVHDLVDEEFSTSVRLVFLCRTERIDLLQAPSWTAKYPLPGMNAEETRAHLLTEFESVSVSEAAEFREQTFGNPRVQASIMSGFDTVSGLLESLTQHPLEEATALDSILERNVATVRANFGSRAHHVDSICEALANLRPRVPIDTIRRIYGVDASLVESFASDLGRPLLIQGGSLQFRDEPTESWFRATFKLDSSALDEFLNRLTPLSTIDTYVCAVLPQLLWEAGRIDQLVTLALNSDGLPNEDTIERAEIEEQRLQFALKAVMRADMKSEVVQLALKAGELAAGNARRVKLLRANTDLAGQWLETRLIEGIQRGRSFKDSRPGGHLPYEAALLASSIDSRDLARSRLRSAHTWIEGWSRRPRSHDGEGIHDEDIAQIAYAVLLTEGSEECAHELSRWRPRSVSFRVGLILCRRMLTSLPSSYLTELLRYSSKDKYLQLAVFVAAARAQHPIRRRRGPSGNHHVETAPQTDRVRHAELA